MNNIAASHLEQMYFDARPIGPLTAMQLAAKGAFRVMVEVMEERASSEAWDEDRHDRRIFEICHEFKVDSVTYFKALDILAAVSR